jgi:hypothetical protein
MADSELSRSKGKCAWARHLGRDPSEGSRSPAQDKGLFAIFKADRRLGLRFRHSTLFHFVFLNIATDHQDQSDEYEHTADRANFLHGHVRTVAV